MEHMLGDCPVVRDSLRRVTTATGFHLDYNQQNLTLNFPPTSTNLPTNVIIHFTSALWKQRQDYFSTLKQPPPHNTAINRLTTYALDQIIPSKPKTISTTKAIAHLALNPPTHTINCFTDGSAKPNPGPTGAGLTCEAPSPTDSNQRIHFHVAAALGHGDNNLGEFYAIYMALKLLQSIASSNQRTTTPTLLIFSDSLLAICHILYGWKLSNAPPIALKTKRLFRALNKLYTIRLYWIRGHSKVPGNERADAEAKKGAEANREGIFSPSSPRVRLTEVLPLPGKLKDTFQKALDNYYT